MGLESATHINDLVGTNPPTTDQVAQGDDHIRLLKNVLKTTFPFAGKPFRFPAAVAASGNTTLVVTDENETIVGDATGGAFNVTLPTLGASNDGWAVRVAKVDASVNAITVVGTINGVANYVLNRQFSMMTFIWTGTAWLAFQDDVIAKILNVTASRVLGRGSAGGAGEAEELSVEAPLEISGTVIRVSGALLQQPQGRLSLSSTVPFIVADVSGASTIYWHPVDGNLIPIYVGGVFVAKVVAAAMPIVLTAGNHAANTIYDLWAALDPADDTTLIVGAGPAWSNSGLATSARGTGAGTPELESIGGFDVNKVEVTLRNNLTTYTIDPRGAFLLGTVLIDAAAAQVTCHVSSGQDRKWHLWSKWQRMQTLTRLSFAGYTAPATALRVANADSANKISYVNGLRDRMLLARGTALVTLDPGDVYQLAVGEDGVVAIPSTSDAGLVSQAGGSGTQQIVVSEYKLYPGIGRRQLDALEFTSASVAVGSPSLRMDWWG